MEKRRRRQKSDERVQIHLNQGLPIKKMDKSVGVERRGRRLLIIEKWEKKIVGLISLDFFFFLVWDKVSIIQLMPTGLCCSYYDELKIWNDTRRGCDAAGKENAKNITKISHPFGFYWFVSSLPRNPTDRIWEALLVRIIIFSIIFSIGGEIRW